MTVIDAWVKQKTAEGNRRAEQILDRFEKDYIGTDGYNNFGYNALMNAYARTEDGATAKVEALFERMQQLASEHNNPGLLPDKLSYSSLMLSLTHEGRRGYADKVDALLKEMEDSPDESVQPDLIAYSVALDAWSKSGEAHAAERARAIPSRMTGPVRPSTVCFNCLMNIYATEGKAEEAESVLEMMDRESRAGNPRTKPRSTDFATCINAWAKSDRLSECWERSSQLFNTMMDRYKAGNDQCKPQQRAITPMFMALANSSETHKAQKALGVIRELESAGIQHNRITCNALIHALSTESGDEKAKKDALKLSLATFELLRGGSLRSSPDSATYNSMMHACLNLMVANPEEQATLFEQVFQLCCNDGKVNSIVLSSMKRAFPNSKLLAVVNGTSEIGIDDVPNSWKRKTEN